MEDDAAGLVLRLALKTRFREIGWGSTPPSSAKHASLTQLVECFAYTEDVGGSSPSGCTMNIVSSLNSLGGLINMVLRANSRVIVE